MNKALILIVALLALAAGLYWWSASQPNPQELTPSQPTSTTSSTPGPSELSNEESRSTNPSRESAPAAPVPNSVSANSKAPAANSSPAAAAPLEVPGSLPSVGTQPQVSREVMEYEQKYGQATAGELLSAHKALQDYYQMHFDGRIEDKSQRLSVDALEALAREIAWLKERAINGPGDG